VGYKSDLNESEDYFTVPGPQLMGYTVVCRKDRNDVYVTNLRSLYKAGVLTGDTTHLTGIPYYWRSR